MLFGGLSRHHVARCGSARVSACSRRQRGTNVLLLLRFRRTLIQVGHRRPQHGAGVSAGDRLNPTFSTTVTVSWLDHEMLPLPLEAPGSGGRGEAPGSGGRGGAHGEDCKLCCSTSPSPSLSPSLDKEPRRFPPSWGGFEAFPQQLGDSEESAPVQRSATER